MSNITLFKQGNIALPDYLREPDDVTKMLAGGSGGKQISIRGGVWRMIVGGEEVAKNEDRAMNFVVLAVNPHTNRTFYADEYEDGKTVDPTCWSNDGVTPNEEVPAAQRQSATCASCPQNVAGSGEGNSRACRFSRRLAVALENDIEGNVYRLQLPAKSIFGKPEGDKMPLQAYAKFLAGHGVPITGVVTEARFDTSEAVPVLRFRAVRPLTREEWTAAKAAAASDDAQRAIEFKMVVRERKSDESASAAAYAEDAPKPKTKPALFGGAAIPARDEGEGEGGAAIEEPVKRQPKKAAPAVPPKASSAADLLRAWGEDDDE